MDELSRRLAKARVIGLDTPVFIYFLEGNQRYSDLTRLIFDGIERGKWKATTSAITLMELTVRPWQLARESVAREYEAVLTQFPNLSLLPIDRAVARAAAQLRARFNLPPPDAFQVAACLDSGARAFLTNDTRLSRLGELIDVILLDDLLTP